VFAGFSKGAKYIDRICLFLNRSWVKREQDEGAEAYTVYSVRPSCFLHSYILTFLHSYILTFLHSYILTLKQNAELTEDLPISCTTASAQNLAGRLPHHRSDP
jgi:hypothetical protein